MTTPLTDTDPPLEDFEPLPFEEGTGDQDTTNDES